MPGWCMARLYDVLAHSRWKHMLGEVGNYWDGASHNQLIDDLVIDQLEI